MDFDNKDGKTNVVDFAHFKQKKKTEEDLARGRKPLYLSHQEGKLKGSPHLKGPAKNEDFGDRILRIRASLEKINTLMHELKKMSSKDDKKSRSKVPSKQDLH